MGDRKNPPPATPAGRAPDPLRVRVDRALATWPEPPADGAADDARAAAITARAIDGVEAESGDDVLAPPLPAEAGEALATTRKKPGVVAWMRGRGAVVAAAAAVAAGVVALALRGRGHDDAARVVAASGGTLLVVPSTSGGAATAGAGSLDVPGVDPATLPVAAAAGATPSGAAPAARRGAAGARPGGSPAGGPPAGPAESDDLAASPDDSLRPAAAIAPGSNLAGGPGSVPRRPGAGAVQAAFGAVLPWARACLGAGDPPYRARVTFRSDGTVGEVQVGSGESGAGPADPRKSTCVRTVLGRATVPPFAEASYEAPVTVRSLGP
jgi:hypothetical protein